MQKGSILKVMEEFKIQGKQTSFYKYCPGTFGYTLVLQLLNKKVQCTAVSMKPQSLSQALLLQNFYL